MSCCLTVLWCYCLAVLLSCCLTVLLSHCLTVLLQRRSKHFESGKALRMREKYDMVMVVSTHPCCAGKYAETG